MKVIQVEQETSLAAVEISTQYVSDQYEDQKTKCNELKSSVINIDKRFVFYSKINYSTEERN